MSVSREFLNKYTRKKERKKESCERLYKKSNLDLFHRHKENIVQYPHETDQTLTNQSMDGKKHTKNKLIGYSNQIN